MSATLYWRPILNGKSLPDALKRALSKRYDLWTPRVFGSSDCEFIEGLIIGGVDGAETLLKLIRKHGDIEVGLEV